MSNETHALYERALTSLRDRSRNGGKRVVEANKAHAAEHMNDFICLDTARLEPQLIGMIKAQ